MNPIDWKAYLEKTLPAAERNRLTARLELDGELRKELAAYQAYCGAIRSAGIAEPVPQERLQRCLAQAVPKPAPARPNWALRLTPVLGALVLLAWAQWRTNDPAPSQAFVFDPYGLAKSAAIESAGFVDPKHAAKWVREKAQFVAPELTLSAGTAVMGAQVGSCWARYDLSLKTEKVHLYMAKKDSFSGAPTVEHGGHTFYVGHGGIGWRKGGLSYYLEGCSSKAQVAMAESTYSMIP